MITCYVIDDEDHAIETLSDLIEQTPGLSLLGSTTNPLAGLEYLTSSTAPDITFVDINMPELSGIEFASLVSNATKIVFTTAYPNYGVEAFEKEAFDYLLKPITPKRFLQTILKYKNLAGKAPAAPATADEYFYVKCDVKGKMTRIKLADITYIEGALNYVIIHLIDNKQQITYLTMSELQNSLADSTFSRIHRSYIVNNTMVKHISGNTIILDDKTILNIGNSYKDSFFENLNKRLIKTKRMS